MEGSRVRLIRVITERTMDKINERLKPDTTTFNIIYEELQEALKIMKESVEASR